MILDAALAKRGLKRRRRPRLKRLDWLDIVVVVEHYRDIISLPGDFAVDHGIARGVHDFSAYPLLLQQTMQEFGTATDVRYGVAHTGLGEERQEAGNKRALMFLNVCLVVGPVHWDHGVSLFCYPGGG
jgi:hypothetical protein